MDEVQHLPVPEDRDRRRGRRKRCEVLTSAFGRLDVTARKDGRDHVGLHRVLERKRDAGARLPRRAPAHRVDHDHDGLVLLAEKSVDRLRGPQFLHAETSELLAHGTDERLWLGHPSIVT